MQKPTELKRRSARKKLKEIVELSKIRQKEILQIHYEKLDGRRNNNPKEARKVNPKNN